MTMIDKKLGIDVPEHQIGNELNAAAYLAVGLNQLYQTVRHYEFLYEQNLAKQGLVEWTGWGNDPFQPPGALHTMPCVFHWYGTSLMNMLRLKGFIIGEASGLFTRADLHDKGKFPTIKKASTDYINKVPEVAEVKKWRNKVAGHFALTDPQNEDAATLEASVMYPVGFAAKRYRVGVVSAVTLGGPGNGQTGELPKWSLTEVHETLAERYPEFIQPQVAAAPTPPPTV